MTGKRANQGLDGEALDVMVEAMTEHVRMTEALHRIMWPGVCESFTSGIGSCWRNESRDPDSPYGADRVCGACLAWDGLGRPEVDERSACGYCSGGPAINPACPIHGWKVRQCAGSGTPPSKVAGFVECGECGARVRVHPRRLDWSGVDDLRMAEHERLEYQT